MVRSLFAMATLILIGLGGTYSTTEAFRQSNNSWITLIDGSTLDGQ